MTREESLVLSLKGASDMVRAEGMVRPTFVVTSAEGVYTIVATDDRGQEPAADALRVVSSLLRWSMARGFIFICQQDSPSALVAYSVTEPEIVGLALPIERRPLRFGSPKEVRPPAAVQHLRALLPGVVSALSETEVSELEEIFEMELGEDRLILVN